MKYKIVQAVPKFKTFINENGDVETRVVKSKGRIKSYIDKRWCKCEAYPAAHIHPKTENAALK